MSDDTVMQQIAEVIEYLENKERGDLKSASHAKEQGWQGFFNGRAAGIGMALFMLRQIRDGNEQVFKSDNA